MLLELFALKLNYLILALGFGWMSWSFWKNYKEEKDIISENFANFQFFLCIGFLIFFLQSFISTDDFLLKEWVWIAGLFFVNTGFSFAGYLVFYLKLPKIPPSYGFRIFFIWAVILMFLTAVLPPQISVLPDGQIELMLPQFIDILSFLQIAAATLPLGIIIIKNASMIKTERERLKSLSLGVICFAGVIAAIFFTFIDAEGLRIVFSIFLAGAIVFLAGIATQKNTGKVPAIK